MQIIYQTTRLQLREFVEADAARLVQLDSDPEVLRYVGMSAPESMEYYLDAIRVRYRGYYERTPGLGYWVLESRSEREFLGWFHLRPAQDYRFAKECGYRIGDIDLGYRLRREVWGRGYATEMARHLVDSGLQRAEVARVVACALVDNLASVRVLEKAGLMREGETQFPGFGSPALVFAIAKTSESGRSEGNSRE